jgi:hypothetical protein
VTTTACSDDEGDAVGFTAAQEIKKIFSITSPVNIRSLFGISSISHSPVPQAILSEAGDP